MNMRSIGYAALALAMAVTSRVAADDNKPTLAGFTEAPGAERLMLVDARPEEDKTQDLGSANIFKCAYGVFRVADDSTVPSRLTLLRSDLAAALGAELEGRSIIVRHYGLYVNNARALRGSAAAAGAMAGGQAAQGVGLAPGIVQFPGMDPDCPPEKMEGGWYGPGETTTGFSPSIAELTVEIDGREYAVRSVISAPKANRKRPKAVLEDPVLSPLLFDALRGANAALVTKLQSER